MASINDYFPLLPGANSEDGDETETDDGDESIESDDDEEELDGDLIIITII